MESDALPTELRLAAIITLLSSSALRGTTASKATALRAHLEAAAFTAKALNPHLRTAIEDALAEWITTECHLNSVPVDFCALAASGQSLH